MNPPSTPNKDPSAISLVPPSPSRPRTARIPSIHPANHITIPNTTSNTFSMLTPPTASADSSGSPPPSGATSPIDRPITNSTEEPVVLGVCAMDVKARSKAMREILTRLVEIEKGGVDVKLFGDMVILEEDITHWPPVDVLISFFSTDFPLPKAILYTQLPNPTRPPPISINSLAMQSLLWDRRLVLAILDHIGVPTPRRAEVSRDGGPKVPARLRERVRRDLGMVLPGPLAEGEEAWGAVVVPDRWKGRKRKEEVPKAKEIVLLGDGDSVMVGDTVIQKPFVEKPVDGEDHNVYIYYKGGGGRKLFRKIGNKSSEFDPNLVHPRTDGSFIYEEFINVDNAEDIKIYTVGPDYTHAETRKSPVVDGLVRRNADGKETRFITQLTDDEKGWARDIVEGFGQRVCGFDLLRCTNDDGEKRSLVIDVNGWSFVKGNQAYYDKAAEILSNVCQTARARKRKLAQAEAMASPNDLQVIKRKEKKTAQTSSSMLRATVTVFRHSDRTPKMKLKFSFPAHETYSKPFLRLLRGHREEIILRDPEQLQYILKAADEAAELPGVSPEILTKLGQLKDVLGKKLALPGTKAQLKPGFFKKKEKKPEIAEGDGTGKPNEEDEGDVTETESKHKQKRVKEWIQDSSNIPTPKLDHAQPVAFVSGPRAPASPPIQPSNASHPPPLTEQIVKDGGKRDETPQSPRKSHSGPMTDPSSQQESIFEEDLVIPEGLEKVQLVVKWGGESTHSSRYQSRDLGDTFKKDLMIMNKDVLNNVRIYTSSERRVINTAQIFAHALLGKDHHATPSSAASLRRPEEETPSPLIKHIIQRRDLLDDNNAAKELIDEAKKKLKILLRPGESEKRPELAWPRSLKKEPVEVVKEVIAQMTELREIMRRNYENGVADRIQQRWCSGDSEWLFRERWEKLFDDFVGIKQEKFDPSRVSELYDSLKYDSLHNRQFLLSIFDPEGKVDTKDGKVGGDRRLHELFARAKALFDLVAPQEYGIDMAAKEEIGVLTSLPLLRKIVNDLSEAKETGNSLACFYFTKESHITTLLHLLLASGLPILPNVRIPELDYCSHISFELYERHSGSAGTGQKDYSIRLSASEGAHSPAVLDSSVDARHTLTVQPRRRLTSHIDYDSAVKALSKHFDKGLSFSTTPLEGDAVYLKKSIQDEAVLPLSLSRHGDETPRIMSSGSSDKSEGA